MSDWRTDPAWPDVDVVMPIRNEADHLGAALAAVQSQQYPGIVRVFMAVGPSTDGTEDVALRLATSDDRLTVIANPSGKTPAALNSAIRAGAAPVVVRVDGHSQLSNQYIRRAIETLRRTRAGNVGGMQVPLPTTPFEEAVTAATSSWLGTGGATYRVGGAEASVDTVYLGNFDRAAIESVGLFDEALIRNQDYELNIRLRAAGYDVVFDPELSVSYTPRGSWTLLAKQYFEYGHWKTAVMRRHPQATRFRQLVPPVVLTCAVGGGALGIRRPALLMAPLGYVSAVLLAARGSSRPLLTALCISTMHAFWVMGLTVGIVYSPERRPFKSRVGVRVRRVASQFDS